MQGPEARHRNFVVVEVLPRHALHFLRIDGVDAKCHLGTRDATTIGEHLLAKQRAFRSAALGTPEDGGLQLALRARDLLISDSVGEHVATEHQLAHSVLHGDLVAFDVKAEHAGVLVEVRESLEPVRAPDIHLVCDVVDNTVSRDGARHQARVLLVGADDLLHHHEGDSVGAPPGYGLPAHRDVGGGSHLVIAVDKLGTAEVGLRVVDRLGSGLHAPEGGRRQLHQLLMLHGAGGSNHHLVRGEILVHVALQLRLGDGLHALEGTDGGGAQGVVTEGTLVEPVIDHGTRRLLRLLQLPHNGLLLLRQVGNWDVRDEVRKDVDTLLDVLVEQGHGVGRLLAAGAHTQHGAQGLHLGLQLGLGPLLRAAQGEALHEVRGPWHLHSLASDTRVQEDPHRGDLAESLPGGHANAIRERGHEGRCLVPCHGLREDLCKHAPAEARLEPPTKGSQHRA
mmetsp:Transcript_128578/g.274226  ORF Transcript_128578/g.274226 Transcript_128578/m.274226 type:complete len:452 (+) Transcript_128578:149-1504(+)